jgi:hypothetical protein
MIKLTLLGAAFSLLVARDVAAQLPYTVEQVGDVIHYISRDKQTICRRYPWLAQNIRRSARIEITRYVRVGGVDERSWVRVRNLSPTETELAAQTFEICMEYLDGISTRNVYLAQRRALAELRTRLGRPPAPAPPQPGPAPPGPAPDYRLYRDPEFGFTVYYPAHLLTPQGESVTGNGETFLSRDGAAKMRVFGVRGPSSDLEVSRGRTRQRLRSVDYADAGPNWVVISGFDADGRVIYEYAAWVDGVRRVLIFEYWPSVRRSFDGPLEIVQRSFRPGPLR